jgi:hypothetical protein
MLVQARDQSAIRSGILHRDGKEAAERDRIRRKRILASDSGKPATIWRCFGIVRACAAYFRRYSMGGVAADKR